jgi:branched-chain amino acid aminotransferase
MDLGKYLWRNGEFIKSKDAQISLINHALHYGSGAWEGIRFYETAKGMAVFRLFDHFKRLTYSAKTIELDIPYDQKTLETATLELLCLNKFKKGGYIRPMSMFGEGKMGLNPKGAQIETFIAAWPWGKYLSDKPINVGISDEWIRSHPKSLQPDAKINGHYTNSIMASLWSQKHKFDEAILCDHEGNLAEGPGENLFIIKNGKLYTPAPGNILPGITRATIMELAKEELDLETIETQLSPTDLETADEAFFTGTACEITLIGSVNNKALREPEGSISRQIQTLYQKVVTGQVEKYYHWLSFVQ